MRAVAMLVLTLPLALAGCEGGTVSTSSAPAAVTPPEPPVVAYSGDRTPLSKNVSFGYETLEDATGSVSETVTVTGADGTEAGKAEATYAFRERFTQVTEGEAATFWFSAPEQSASGSMPVALDPRRLSRYGDGAIFRVLLDRDRKILDAVAAAGPRGPVREPDAAEKSGFKNALLHAFAAVPKGKLVNKGDVILDLSDWAKSAWGTEVVLKYTAAGWTVRGIRPAMIGELKPVKGPNGLRVTGYALIDIRSGTLIEHEVAARFRIPGAKASTAIVHTRTEIQIGKKS